MLCPRDRCLLRELFTNPCCLCDALKWVSRFLLRGGWWHKVLYVPLFHSVYACVLDFYLTSSCHCCCKLIGEILDHYSVGETITLFLCNLMLHSSLNVNKVFLASCDNTLIRHLNFWSLYGSHLMLEIHHCTPPLLPGEGSRLQSKLCCTVHCLVHPEQLNGIAFEENAEFCQFKYGLI